MIIFLGLAGSGKSTQGQRLAKHLGCRWLSTGQLLRENVEDKTLLDEMLSGEMIKDEVLFPYIEKALLSLESDKNEIILDGSPRTVNQARWLMEKVKEHGIKITAIIHLSARESVVKKRLLERGRPDDHEDAIAERFREYELTILPILNFLREQGLKVFNIDGEQSEDAVQAEIERAIELGSADESQNSR